MEDDADVMRVITCVDCGGRAHLLTKFDADYPRPQPGDALVYRCEDCLDRWDLIVPDEADARGDAPPLE